MFRVGPAGIAVGFQPIGEELAWVGFWQGSEADTPTPILVLPDSLSVAS